MIAFRPIQAAQRVINDTRIRLTPPRWRLTELNPEYVQVRDAFAMGSEGTRRSPFSENNITPQIYKGYNSDYRHRIPLVESRDNLNPQIAIEETIRQVINPLTGRPNGEFEVSYVTFKDDRKVSSFATPDWADSSTIVSPQPGKNRKFSGPILYFTPVKQVKSDV